MPSSFTITIQLLAPVFILWFHQSPPLQLLVPFLRFSSSWSFSWFSFPFLPLPFLFFPFPLPSIAAGFVFHLPPVTTTTAAVHHGWFSPLVQSPSLQLLVPFLRSSCCLPNRHPPGSHRGIVLSISVTVDLYHFFALKKATSTPRGSPTLQKSTDHLASCWLITYRRALHIMSSLNEFFPRH